MLLAAVAAGLLPGRPWFQGLGLASTLLSPTAWSSPSSPRRPLVQEHQWMMNFSKMERIWVVEVWLDARVEGQRVSGASRRACLRADWLKRLHWLQVPPGLV
jgi:hypothetical protein